MSNYLAVASVTAVLKELIEKAILASHAGGGSGSMITVTTVRPSDKTNITKRGANIFLHHVTPNAQWRNHDLPSRRSDGALVRRPVAAVDLHYVLTFHGDETKWEPQQFYGVALRTLNTQPILSRDLVKKAIDAIGATTGFAFIRASDLAEAIEQVRLVPTPLTLDELSKIWSSFYQTEYSLATVYTASPVFVEGEEAAQEALPVRTAGVHVAPFAEPVIERVRRADDQPITAGAQVRIEGRHLRGELTRLLLDDAPYTGPLDAGYEVATATLPAAGPDLLYAGLHRAQIVHLVALGAPPTPHRGVESNAAPFTLHPIVTGAPTIRDRTARVVGGVTLVSGTLDLPLSPRVHRAQRVLLLLNAASSAAPTAAYSFAAAPRPDGPVDPIDAAVVSIAFTDVRAGSYFLRAQVDGATSVPSPGPDFPTVSIA